MRVASENFTVLPDPLRGEISLLIAGLNIILDLEEARELTRQLVSSMQALSRAERFPDRIARPPEPAPAPEAPVFAGLTRNETPRVDATESAKTAAEPASAAARAAEPPGAAVEPSEDRRAGRRLRGLFKVLAKDEDDGALAGGL